MITAKDIKSLMSAAEPLFGRLQDLYQQLPETHCMCEQLGSCCLYLPEITVLEAMQWMRLMQALPELEMAATFRKFVEFYLTNPVRAAQCPFLVEGACSIYAYRTFGCRSYGLWSQKMGTARTQESRKGKKALRQVWKHFGLELPADIVEFEMDYCDKVQILGDSLLPDDAIMDLLKQAYDLGKPLSDLQARFEKKYHSDFSFLVTSLVLGMKEALLEKFAVIKEIVQKGTDRRLQQALVKVRPEVLRF